MLQNMGEPFLFVLSFFYCIEDEGKLAFVAFAADEEEEGEYK